MRVLLSVLCLLTAACGNYSAWTAQTRAANDFGCDSSQVDVTPIGGGAYRATGCGYAATYVCQPSAKPRWFGDSSALESSHICQREAEPAPRPVVAFNTQAPPRREAPARGFNKEAAVAAATVAASFAAECKQEDGPRGEGTVHMTFDPSGRVSRVSVDAPYEGTAVGQCVIGRFHRVTVPAFEGEPVKVRKTFLVE
jgi:hypothetical protein